MWRYVLVLAAWVAVAQEGAVSSPSGKRSAYYELCFDQDRRTCPPNVVILNRDEQRERAFPVMTEFGPCMSILRLWWIGEDRIGAECHMNPSVTNYIETDLATGKTLRNLLGYAFTPSPDGKHIAHAGPNPHFAPVWAHSDYLQIDDTTVYPLARVARGAKPTSERPDVVVERGGRWVGIHGLGDFKWSPDSIRVAFTDCTFDWVAKAGVPEGGAETNNRCRRRGLAVRARRDGISTSGGC